MADVLSLFGNAQDDVWQMGHRGDEVTAFQRQLVTLGFSALNVDGVVGPEMVSAIRALQRNLDIEVDGLYGPETRAAFADDVRSGGGATALAGREWSRHGSPDEIPGAAALMGTDPGVGSAVTFLPQQIQVPSDEPFWKNPMVWIGLGGAALLLYFFTKGDDAGLASTDFEFDAEDEDDEEGVADPEEFFAEAPKRKRRSSKKKPAAVKKPRKRRKKKGDLGAAPMPTDLPADSGTADLEGTEVNPPKPRRRKRKATGEAKLKLVRPKTPRRGKKK